MNNFRRDLPPLPAVGDKGTVKGGITKGPALRHADPLAMMEDRFPQRGALPAASKPLDSATAAKEATTNESTTAGTSPSRSEQARRLQESQQQAVPQVPSRLYIREIHPKAGIAPRPRWGHVAATHGSSMYIFGGFTTKHGHVAGTGVHDGSGGHEATNDMFEYDFEKEEWGPSFISKGASPPPRYMHSGITFEDMFVIFGGTSAATNGRLYNDVHVYNFQTQEWQLKETTGKAPAPRAGHTAVKYKHRMYVFGGRCHKKQKEGEEGQQAAPLKQVPSGDVHYLDLRTWEWKTVAVHHGKQKADDSRAAGEDNTTTEGNKDLAGTKTPAKRSGHCAAVIGHVMYIHGGEDGHGAHLCDLWGFSLIDRTWRCYEQGLTSADLNPRFRHQVSVVGGSTLVFVGGARDTQLAGAAPAAVVVSFDTRNGMWMRHETLTGRLTLDSSFAGFSTVLYHGFVYAFGGSKSVGGSTAALHRFLATTGVVSDALGHRYLNNTMQHVLRDGTGADVGLEIGGEVVKVHSVILWCRAPGLLEKIEACGSYVNQQPDTRAGALKVYQLEGNKRRSGLEGIRNKSHLNALLAYIYYGSIPQLDEQASASAATARDAGLTDAVEDTLSFLAEAARTFNLGHLGKAVQAAVMQNPSGPAGLLAGRASSGKDVATATLREHMLLAADAMSGKNIVLELTDPDTNVTVEQEAHWWVLFHGSALFRRLLHPLTHRTVAPPSTAAGKKSSDGKSERALCDRHQEGGVTAEVRPDGAIRVTGLRVPAMGMKYCLQYLYTGQHDGLPLEAVQAVLITAAALRIRALEVICQGLIADQLLTPESACDWLVLAAKYNADHLKELALMMAVTNFRHVNKDLLTPQLYAEVQAVHSGRGSVGSSSGARMFQSSEAYSQQFSGTTPLAAVGSQSSQSFA